MRASREQYRNLAVAEIERKLREVRDRATRAMTMEAALADAYDEQELSAALYEKAGQ